MQTYAPLPDCHSNNKLKSQWRHTGADITRCRQYRLWKFWQHFTHNFHKLYCRWFSDNHMKTFRRRLRTLSLHVWYSNYIWTRSGQTGLRPVTHLTTLSNLCAYSKRPVKLFYVIYKYFTYLLSWYFIACSLRWLTPMKHRSSLYHMVRKVFRYLEAFRRCSRVWQTDGQNRRYNSSVV